MRNYNELISAVISSLPSKEEMTALSQAEIENLRRCGNTLDNWLYLELLRRRGDLAALTAGQ